MNIDYILYLAVTVVFLAFITIVYMGIVSIKKKLVNKKVDKFSIKSGKRVTQKDLDKILSYIEKNKKHLSHSAYKIGLYKINKAKKHMQVS